MKKKSGETPISMEDLSMEDRKSGYGEQTGRRKRVTATI